MGAASTYFARRFSDHQCAGLLQSITVDDCAPGQYCIDSVTAAQSRCIDLEDPAMASTNFVGVEKKSALCLLADASGSLGVGVSYCKTAYCVSTQTAISMCKTLTDLPMRRGKRTAD
jgi:hypothetical protein